MLQMNLWDKLIKVKRNLLVYEATQEENKFSFLAELSRFCATNHEPLLVGDFNIIRWSA